MQEFQCCNEIYKPTALSIEEVSHKAALLLFGFFRLLSFVFKTSYL